MKQPYKGIDSSISFAFVSFGRFLATFCPEFRKVSLESGPQDREDKKVPGRRLEIHLWTMAFDRWALAAAALDQVHSSFSRFALFSFYST